jgi:hypothetical protein
LLSVTTVPSRGVAQFDRKCQAVIKRIPKNAKVVNVTMISHCLIDETDLWAHRICKNLVHSRMPRGRVNANKDDQDMFRVFPDDANVTVKTELKP